MKCNICNSTTFIEGPNGRLTKEGLAPRCTSCRSLERHRAARALFDVLQTPNRFRQIDVLDGSHENYIEETWFRTTTKVPKGQFGQPDPSKLSLSKNSFGVIVISNTIEYATDYKGAIGSLFRALKPTGFMSIQCASPANRATTDDWGFNDPKRNNRLRIFGNDFGTIIKQIFPNTHVIAIEPIDPVTKESEVMHIVTNSQRWANVLMVSGYNYRLIVDKSKSERDC